MSRSASALRCSRLIALWAIACTLAACGHAKTVADAFWTPARAREVLATTRPGSAAGHFARASAWLYLDQAQSALDEARLGLAYDTRSGIGDRLEGFAELRLGHRGAALRALQRAQRKHPQSPSVPRLVAALLRERARERLAFDHGREAPREAQADVTRSNQLDPGHKVPIPADWSTTTQDPGPAGPETVAALSLPAASSRAGCRLQFPGRRLAELLAQYVFLGHRGVALARELTVAGCHRAARRVWQALVDESPRSPLVLRGLGRALIVLGKRGPAQQVFVDAIYFATDRAQELLRIARLTLEAGDRMLCGHYAVRAFSLARDPTLRSQVLELLEQAQLPEAATALRTQSLSAVDRSTPHIPRARE